MTTTQRADQTVVRPVPTVEPFLPFTRPSINSDDIAAVVKVLESAWITSGAKVEQLEHDLSEFTGCDHAVAVNSATSGMQLILHALGIGPGDEVITPSMTWVSTINLITLSGATPVFVDVDRNTLMTDAERIERAITDRTRLIVPVHFAGAPLDLDPIKAVAREHGLPVVEDAAHALGACYRGIPVGRNGTSVFSLQAIKNVTAAEGGVICTDDAALAERLRRARFHGLGAEAWARHSQGRSPAAEVLEPGYKCNLPDMNAALALGQLKRLDDLIARRSDIAHQYLQAFGGIESLQALELPGYPHAHAWHLFVVRVDARGGGIQRQAFMDALQERQIGSGVHFRAAHTHKYYATLENSRAGDLQNTEWNSERVVSLPLFPDMTQSDVNRVIDCVRTVSASQGV